MIPPFILASASPRRLALLAQIGLVPLKVEPSAVDETPLKSELPREYAERIARQKAEVAAMHNPGIVVLAADTVVHMGRRILPKAEDEKTARNCLEQLSGRRHRATTAVVVAKDKAVVAQLVTTMVRFKRLSEKEISIYIAAGEWHGKAGGYAIQGQAAAFIPFINGSYSNVVGLPLAETRALLLSDKIVARQ